MNTQDILTQSDIDRFITRALSFDIDSTLEGSPKATELIAKVSAEMYKQIVVLAGRGVNIPGSGLERVKNMERVLTALEMKKQKELVLFLYHELILSLGNVLPIQNWRFDSTYSNQRERKRPQSSLDYD
jgi:hypothetical protein